MWLGCGRVVAHAQLSSECLTVSMFKHDDATSSFSECGTMQHTLKPPGDKSATAYPSDQWQLMQFALVSCDDSCLQEPFLACANGKPSTKGAKTAKTPGRATIIRLLRLNFAKKQAQVALELARVESATDCLIAAGPALVIVESRSLVLADRNAEGRWVVRRLALAETSISKPLIFQGPSIEHSRALLALCCVPSKDQPGTPAWQCLALQHNAMDPTGMDVPAPFAAHLAGRIACWYVLL